MNFYLFQTCTIEVTSIYKITVYLTYWKLGCITSQIHFRRGSAESEDFGIHYYTTTHSQFPDN